MNLPRAMMPLKVIVVGAGIGGMAAARALGLRGHRVVVLESAPKLMEIGAGIQLSPNMLRIFDRWGVSDLIHSRDVALEYTHIRRWQDGSLLSTLPVNKTYGHQTVIHRADLHNSLIEKALELDNVELRVNCLVTDVQFSPASVKLSDGTVVRGDVVIGADGIKSTLRARLLNDPSDHSIPTGDAAYRMVLTRAEMETDPQLKELIDRPEATRWLGPNRHIIAYPLRRGELFNVVMVHPDRDGVTESWTTKSPKQNMIDDYRGWDSRITKLIELAPDEVLEWKLRLHAPLKTWIRGNVALLGDACHPTLPYIAQGAAQAVEDAAALGVLLSIITSRDQIPLALQAYEKSRKERADSVAQSGTDNRATLHLHDGPEQRARDEIFRSPPTPGGIPDRWANHEAHRFLWGWDAEKVALETWNELNGDSRPLDGRL